jgi:exodeoxyribonuclease-3
MKIATWNINGVKARLEIMLQWLQEARPDVVCLQEIKSVDEGFPIEAVQDIGYNAVVHGQKGFNGVALLSLRPLDDVQRGLPGNDEDLQARYIEAIIPDERGPIRLGGLYLPNGNPIGTDKFTYKLGWMDRLHRHAELRLGDDTPLILAGDFNVIPDAADARFPKQWAEDALFQPESRAAWRRLVNLGFVDAVRTSYPGSDVYTFWDYQAGAWQKNNGIRIDHMLLSAAAADRLEAVGIDKHVRAWEKPSDHVPVWVVV